MYRCCINNSFIHQFLRCTNSRYIITDIKGQIISIYANVADFVEVDISQLSSGVYLAHLVQGETRMETKKMVKR
ncbi:MAG: T9SS type A sorting domain-containing protein [Crocinitomicaceae bacterium]|nr:T9SS type A sorting domain-containing protein [Crocinitomicaceae bacterium]